LEILYSRYPSTEYEISSFDKIIKDENNNSKSASAQTEVHNTSRPKTYKITITKINANQQRIFRNELLDHYERCIITGISWNLVLDAAHIMPYKQVGSFLSTGFPLRKDLHWLWDRFHVSINPEICTVSLSEEASNFSDYSQYNNFKLLDETVRLLKGADIQILKQHYDKFKEMEYSRKHQIQNKVKIFKKKLNKKPLARPKNQEDNCYDESITELRKIIMYYDEFISQIWNNDPAPTWYKLKKRVPKNEIYSAFVEFNNKKNGKQQSTDHETDDDNDDDDDFRPEKQKAFWQNMYKVICEPNGKAKMKIGDRTVYYICLFPKDIIIQNVRKLNDPREARTSSSQREDDAERKTKQKQQIPQQKSLIKHNVKTVNDVGRKSKENNSNKKGKETKSFQKNQGEPSAKKLKLSLSSEQQINSVKKVAEFNNAKSLFEKTTLQKIKKSSKKTLKISSNNKFQINRNSSNNNNTFQTDLLFLSNEVDDLRNENSNYIDEIDLNDLESFEFVENIQVNKKNIRKDDKERMINYKGNAIEENNINNDEEHEKIGEESHKGIDENKIFPSQEDIKKDHEKKKLEK
jgi:hypothetical protein